MQTPKVNQDFFVESGCDIQKGDNEYVTLARLSKDQLKERWSTQRGKYILNTWRANRFDRKALDDLVGRFYGHTDLRGISLIKEDLNGLYFSIMTFTTLGSDIQSISTLGKVLVSIEASIGFLMTGLLVAILVKRTIGD